MSLAFSRTQALESLRTQIDDIVDSKNESESNFNDMQSQASGDCSHDDKSVTDRNDDAQVAYQKILRLCSFRERSTDDLRKLLLKSGFNSSIIDEALERAKRLRVVDNERYADALVRSTIAAGKGLHGLRHELDSLGISLESLSAWEEYEESGNDEVTRALDLLRRKPPRSKNRRDGAYRKLVSRGFSSSVASQASRIWSEETDETSLNWQ